MDPQSDNASTVSANGGTTPDTGNGVGTPPTATPTGAGAPTQDPYSIFISNLTAMLKQAQAANATGQANLGGAKDTLVNESVSGGTPTPFMPGIFSGAQVGNQEAVENAFQPAITSINTQMENENTQLSDINQLAGTMSAYYKPEAISPGQSLVMPDGTIVTQGHSYQPTLNSVTGLMDGFDQNTGTWASDDQKGPIDTTTAGSTPATIGIVGGIDLMGGSVGMKPWATDPNYTTEVNTLYQQVQKSSPIPSAPTLDAFIKSMARSSPITGAMIMNAAATYKIDPNLLAAVIGHESDFGTSGTTTLQINNPAGITGSDGKYTPFNSWTQGVNATAQDLAKRIVKPTTGATGTNSTSPIGGQFSPTATSKIQQLPQSMQSYVDAGPQGVAYINNDRVPAALQTAVQTMASRAGIPYLQGDDVNAIKSIGVVYQSIKSMQDLVSTNLHPGLLGRGEDIFNNGLNNLFQGSPDLTKFTSYRDTAIKAVQALAGGAGSGLRINGAEIEANVNNLPITTDNSETAQAKLSQLSTFLNQQLAATFPYITTDTQSSSGAAPASSSGMVTMTGPNGTFTVPQSQVATMQQNGYTSQ